MTKYEHSLYILPNVACNTWFLCLACCSGDANSPANALIVPFIVYQTFVLVKMVRDPHYVEPLTQGLRWTLFNLFGLRSSSYPGKRGT